MTAYAGNGAMAVGYVGPGGRVTHYAAPREPAAWPHQVGVIPSRALSFQHRAEVDRLRAAVAGGGTAVLGQVLTGLGGVGKTQLAADYAAGAWDDGGLDVLVWVTASARAAVVSGYAQAGAELCRADPEDPEQAARTFLAWLAPKPAGTAGTPGTSGAAPCRWLVVLDDVADPDDLRGLWPPASPYGTTLVTTRRRDAALTGQGRHRIDIGVFTEAEAVAYLTASLAAQGRSEPVDELRALAADLGHLPLALAQAAAYVVDSGDDVADYRALLADRATTLADATPDRLPDEQAIPLAAAWSLSIDRADSLRPVGLARPMLQLAALLAPNGIPEAVLTSGPVLTHLREGRDRIGLAAPSSERVTAREAKGALRALHRLSLIDHTPGIPHQAVRVHQLIQRATRDTFTPEERDRFARTAADALVVVWPEIERDTDLAEALRACTTALTACAEDALYEREAHDVLYRMGLSLGESGRVTAAVDHFHHLAATSTRHLGPDHPDTLVTRGNLAHWRGEAGDVVGAAAALEELLAERLRVSGPDHPNTLTTRSNLAHCRGEAGDVAGAVAALEGLLADRLRVLGPDHPDTLNTRNNLAHWWAKAGDGVEAAVAVEALLAKRLRVLGPDHPDTLKTRAHLAYLLGEARDVVGAAAALEELLADQLRVFGPDHPDTLTSRNNLAFVLGDAGDAAGAVAAFEDLLTDRLRVLGPDHPHTLATRDSLAYWRREAGEDDPVVDGARS